jgi:hypothetical protein
MGNSIAYPLRQSADVDELFALAGRLLDVAVQGEKTRAELYLHVPGREELRRLLTTIPNAQVTPTVQAHADESGNHALPYADHYLLDFEVPIRDAKTIALAVLEFCPQLQLTWDYIAWPAVPALGLWQHFKYASVQICFHHQSVYLGDNPTPDHSLLVHTDGPEERAEWLAEQVGAHVVGPALFW